MIVVRFAINAVGLIATRKAKQRDFMLRHTAFDGRRSDDGVVLKATVSDGQL